MRVLFALSIAVAVAGCQNLASIGAPQGGEHRTTDYAITLPVGWRVLAEGESPDIQVIRNNYEGGRSIIIDKHDGLEKYDSYYSVMGNDGELKEESLGQAVFNTVTYKKGEIAHYNGVGKTATDTYTFYAPGDDAEVRQILSSWKWVR